MAFGRLRKLFRREPTRRELYLQLARGLNIERDYQSWIERWEDYGPTRTSTGPLPLTILIVGPASDDGYWDQMAREHALHIVRTVDFDRGWQFKEGLAGVLDIARDYIAVLHASDQ